MSGTLAEMFARHEFIEQNGEVFLPVCQKCYVVIVKTDGDLCPICANENRLGYEIVQLTGRCATGEERGRGVLYHAVLPNGRAALCRAKPGIRSAGWSSHHGEEVTCPRCLKIIARRQAGL